MKILVNYPIPRKGLSKLNNKFELTYPNEGGFSYHELLEHMPDHEALLVTFNQKVDKKLIDAGSKLKIIANYGVGYNNIDVAYATEKGIVITNTPNPVTEPTANLCIGLILSLTRRINELDAALRSGKPVSWGVMDNLGMGISGKILGIVGMGKIGKAVARRAKAFGMHVAYYSRTRLHREEEVELGVLYLPFIKLLSAADIISLHTPLTEKTTKLIGISEFTLMKPNALLINTARGAVIDEEALVDAIYFDEIAGAALDVFENEPQIHKELKKLKNVVIVPHIGTSTLETRTEMAEEAALNISDYFNHKTPQNLIPECKHMIIPT